MHTTILMVFLGSLPAALSRELPPFSNTTALPVHFAVLLWPGYQLGDAMGAIDIFNTLVDEYDLHNTTTFEVIGETRDPISTIGKNTNRTFGQSVVVTTTHDEVISSDKPIDVLLVPGGGSRGAQPAAGNFIKAVYPRLQYLISVCSGATIVASAGLLDGRKATTSKANFNRLITTHTKVKWQAPARWVVDGNIWTGSGGHSSPDIAIAWIAHVYGAAVADYLGNLVEYTRAHNSTDDVYSAYWGAKGV